MIDNLSSDPLAEKIKPLKIELPMAPDPEAQARVAARRNGTKARLITQHKGPNKDPTPGANYKDHNIDDLKKSFGETHDHSISQWQAGKGVVGPTGQEGSWFFSGFNTPSNSAYEANQNFGYQHDMQATDADLQAKTPEERKAYDKANYESAKSGFWVLKTSGDLKKSLKRTQEIFREHGFIVRESY